MTSINIPWTNSVNFAAKTDVSRVATALITQRLFQKKPLNEQVWIVSTALTILGFVSYQLLINSWFDTSKLAEGSSKQAIDDILKFSTMYFITRLLSGQSLSDPEWIKDTGLFVGSIVLYDVALHDVVNNRTANLDKNVGIVLRNLAKWGGVLSAHNFAKGGEFDNEWMMTTAGFVTGLCVYDVVLSKYVEGRF